MACRRVMVWTSARSAAAHSAPPASEAKSARRGPTRSHSAPASGARTTVGAAVHSRPGAGEVFDPPAQSHGGWGRALVQAQGALVDRVERARREDRRDRCGPRAGVGAEDDDW